MLPSGKQICCIVYLLAISLSPIIATAETTSNFVFDLETFKSFEYEGENVEGQQPITRYRLYIPPSMDRRNKYPLIVWMHGFGEAGDDNVSQLRWVRMLFEDGQTNAGDFFILATQCPEGHPHWFKSNINGVYEKGAVDEPLTVLRRIIDRVVNSLPIDNERILLTGVSSGANGCLEMGVRYPDLFAGIAPMGANLITRSRAPQLRVVPVWAFVSAKDGTYAADIVESALQSANDAGGRCALTVTGDPTHNCWTTAFKQYDLLGWLLSQRKGSAVGRSAGTVPRNYLTDLTRILPAVVLMGLVVAAIRREFSRRIALRGRTNA